MVAPDNMPSKAEMFPRGKPQRGNWGYLRSRAFILVPLHPDGAIFLTINLAVLRDSQLRNALPRLDATVIGGGFDRFHS